MPRSEEVIGKIQVQECKWSPAVVAVVALLCRDPATPRTHSWLKAKPSYQTTVYNEASLRLISSACGASPSLLSAASPASPQCLREYSISLWRTSFREKSSWDIRRGSIQIESNQNNWFCNNCFRYSENIFNLHQEFSWQVIQSLRALFEIKMLSSLLISQKQIKINSFDFVNL